MYPNARGCARVNGILSEEFVVKDQYSIISPLLSIVLLESLSPKFRSGCPQELLYADDLVQIAELMEELIEKFQKMGRLWHWVSEKFL